MSAGQVRHSLVALVAAEDYDGARRLLDGLTRAELCDVARGFAFGLVLAGIDRLIERAGIDMFALEDADPEGAREVHNEGRRHVAEQYRRLTNLAAQLDAAPDPVAEAMRQIRELGGPAGDES